VPRQPDQPIKSSESLPLAPVDFAALVEAENSMKSALAQNAKHRKRTEDAVPQQKIKRAG
jgi:hypothetical protein